MIVGGKEAPRHLPPHGVPPPCLPPPPVSVGMLPTHSLAATMATTSTSQAFDRARLLGPSGYPGVPPHLGGPWGDPFRDPYRSAQEMSVRAHDLATREALLRGDPLRDPRMSLVAREEQLLHANPLSSLILSERYREQQQQQARELFEHRHLAATGGLYPPTSLLPHPAVSHMASSLLKGGPTLGPGPPGPGLHPSLGSMHGPSHPGAPGHPQPPPPLGPGLPPPLIPSMRGASPAHPRPPDKKDDPR